jgi:hypothetical protein
MRFVGLLVLVLTVAGAVAHAEDEASCLDRCGTDAHAVFVACRTQNGRLDDCLDAATDASGRCTARCPSTTPPDLRCTAVGDDVIRQCMVQIADAIACAQLRDGALVRCRDEMARFPDAETDGARPACSSSD